MTNNYSLPYSQIVELLRNLPHYEILFQKFVKSYFYHFGYHCRLGEYGFQKLAELFETVDGLIRVSGMERDCKSGNVILFFLSSIPPMMKIVK